jgi:hypothetical protein
VRAVDLIQWAPDRQAAAVEDVGVDHGGLDVLMAEEVLHGPNVIAVFQEMGGEGVAEGVASDALSDVRAAGGECDGLLDGAAAGVVAALDAGPRVFRNVTGGEHVLPDPLPAGGRVFPAEGVGEVGGTEAGRQVFLVEAADESDVSSKGFDEAFRQDGDPVTAALSIADKDLAQAEVDVFDAQADALRDAQAAAVEELCREAMGWGEGVDEAGCLRPAEDRREVFGAVGADGVDGFVEGLLEDGAEEEEEGVERLILSRCRDLAIDGEVSEEGPDVGSSEVPREAAMVEHDEAADPAQVADFGTEGVVLTAEDEAGLVEDSGAEGVHGDPLGCGRPGTGVGCRREGV